MPNNITRSINKKKQLCLPQNKGFVHWYDFAPSHYTVASGSVPISLIFLQSIVCLWRRPRRASRGRSPVHLWVGSFIHAAGFGGTCASTLKFTLSLVESVTLLMLTHESNRITQWPVVSDGSKGWEIFYNPQTCVWGGRISSACVIVITLAVFSPFGGRGDAKGRRVGGSMTLEVWMARIRIPVH